MKDILRTCRDLGNSKTVSTASEAWWLCVSSPWSIRHFFHFHGMSSLFANLQLWLPYRSRLGAPVAAWLCPQRDCGFLLWLRHIIYGHSTGGDQQSDWPRLRSVSSLPIKGFFGMFTTSWFSACEREKYAWSSFPAFTTAVLLCTQAFGSDVLLVDLKSVQPRCSLVWHLCDFSFCMQREPASAVHLPIPFMEFNFCWPVFEAIKLCGWVLC